MASSGPSDDNSHHSETLYSSLQDTDFFRSLVENGSDAIVSIDEDSTILYANRAVERMFGYEPAELIGEELTMIMPERFRSAHFDALGQYLKTDERTLDWNDIELPAEHKDGHEVSLSITFEEHEYDGERIFSGIMRDISERVAHEENLVTLQELAQDLMQIQDPHAIAEEVVSAAKETLAFPIVSIFFYDEATDQLQPAAHTETVHDIFDEIPTLGEGSLAWAAFHEGEPRTYIAADEPDNETADETPVLRPDGPINSEYIFPLADQGCMLVSTTDHQALDDRALTLAQLLAANTESALIRAEREVERERQREQLEKFANIVSHDLRDPINTARATAAVARAGDEDALDELDDLFDRMDALIEDVLVLAKQGKAVGDTESVDTRAIAMDAWQTVETAAASLQLDELSTVTADSERLQTLFENLFRNAVEHGGATVTVSVGDLADGTGFYVADDGPGFGDADVDKLFEYGYTTASDNTGFGLNIVAEIVEAHGWRIEAVSKEQPGARFEITTQ